MKRAFLIAFGIALPLWVRQHRFERALVRETQESIEALRDGTQEALEKFATENRKWSEELMTSIKEEFAHAR